MISHKGNYWKLAQQRLPETFAHGTMLSLSCWDERYRGFYDDSAASVDSLSCVNGQWLLDGDFPEVVIA